MTTTAAPVSLRRRLRPARSGGAAAIGLAAVLLLAGCGTLPDLLPSQRGGTAADPEALRLAWSTPASEPSWIPADATVIRWVARTTGGADAAPAAVRLRSGSALPASCTADAGPSAAAITAAWTPGSPDSGARRCGNWVVTAVPGGYYAWTPAEAGTGS